MVQLQVKLNNETRSKMETNYIITDKQISTLAKYLFTRPYQEVAGLIGLLNNLTKLDPKINPNFVRDEGKKNDTQSK